MSDRKCLCRTDVATHLGFAGTGAGVGRGGATFALGGGAGFCLGVVDGVGFGGGGALTGAAGLAGGAGFANFGAGAGGASGITTLASCMAFSSIEGAGVGAEPPSTVMEVGSSNNRPRLTRTLATRTCEVSQT